MTAESKRAKGDVEMTYVCQLIKLSKKIMIPGELRFLYKEQN